MEKNNKEIIDLNNINELFLIEKYKNILPDLKTIETFNIKKIDNNIYALIVDGINIDGYVDNHCNDIISILGIRKLKNYSKYSKLIGIAEQESESGEYELFILEKGLKNRKLDKYSVEYFEVWQKFSFLQGRDTALNIYKGDSRKTIMKMEDKLLNMMIKDDVLRLVDLVVFLQKGNITKEQFEKYITQLKAQLLEQIGDSRFSLLDNNFKFHITHEGNRYEINTGKVNEDEINYLFKAGLISQDLHKLAMEKYHELERLEKEKKGEITKPLDNLKGEIQGKQSNDGQNMDHSD